MTERRWIVVGEDGRYVTLGRHSDPTPEEIREAEQGLRGQGLAGFLAVMEGNPFVGCLPRIMEVRPLADPARPFAAAAAACVAAIAAGRETLGR